LFLKDQSERSQEEFFQMFKDFIGKILNLLPNYLPYNDKIVEVLDFVEFKDPIHIFKQKLKYFSEYFNLIPEDKKSQLQDELMKLKSIKSEFYRDSSEGNLHFWDRIKNQENISLIPNIIYFAETLPITSAGIEQSFSLIKLLKTEKRNQLKETTLEGLTLISQEFADQKQIFINEKMMKLFIQVKHEFNGKKRVIQIPTNIKHIEMRKSDSQLTNHLEESKEQRTSEQKSKALSTSIDQIYAMNEEFFDIQRLKKSEGENVRDVLNENELLDEQNLYPVEKKVKTK